MAIATAGCRGMESDNQPVHVVLNMDFQPRFDPQERNPFFADNRSMRMPVPGTVARGLLNEDVRFYEGRDESGGYVARLPLPTTRELLVRGGERYDIYCTPCHGRAGDGKGIVTTGGYGYTPAPTYHSDRLRQVSDGYLYDVIANGVRTMPAYGHQVPPADRWAITAYIRALQRSQYAREEDVPPSIRAEIGSSVGGAGQAALPGDETGGAAADTAAGGQADTSAAAGGRNQ